MKKQSRKELQIEIKGITLVSLVVTIVILLILAGITIGIIFGTDGMIGKATMSAFLTEMSQIEENVYIKKTSVMEGQYLNNENVSLFDERISGRSDIKIPDTFKQQLMYIREGMPRDKKPEDYAPEDFNGNEVYVIDKETGNGKKDTYAYDEINGAVFKIPQTKIDGNIYHCKYIGVDTRTDGETDGSLAIIDEAEIVTVDGESFYEPDLNNFNATVTQIVYYSNDFSKQITKTAEEYIKEEKKNKQIIEGEEYQFYNYKNQQWANVKTVMPAEVNSPEVENWWVWIPRYAYKVNGTSNTIEPISVIYIDLNNKPLNPKYNGMLPEGYEVHPAFTPSGEDGSKNLKGIWMSKYEPSILYKYQKPKEEVLAPDMTNFNGNVTYIELYDSQTGTFNSEIKLADANLSTINNEKKWYDYPKQQYANIKTVVEGAENWWVWIPRYAYRKSVVANEMLDIIFVDLNNKPLHAGYNGELPEGYEVHPAFTPSGEDGSKNLRGIWMSKYEPSSLYRYQKPKEEVLAPDMTNFNRDNTYIELYDSQTGTFNSEIKLADTNLSTINSEKKWYDYSKQQYANIKTVVDGVENWWVWIPRYAYRKSVVANEMLDIIFVDLNNKPLYSEYNGELPEGYEIHPAFNPSGGDGSKNLQGIWFSKYEPSKIEK